MSENSPTVDAKMLTSKESSGETDGNDPYQRAMKIKEELVYSGDERESPVVSMGASETSFESETRRDMFDSNVDGQSREIYQLDKTCKSSFECNLCLKIYSRKNNFNKHMREVHWSPLKAHEKSVNCEICHKLLSCKESLSRHKSAVHTFGGESNPAFECEICHKTFSCKPYVTRHKRYVHKLGRASQKKIPFKCETCGKTFNCRRYLTRHKGRMHPPLPSPCGASKTKIPFNCDLCYKTLTCDGSLKQHKRLVHKLETVVCEICHKTFSRKKYLIKHKRRLHTPGAASKNEKPVISEICEICHKTFSRKGDLNKHNQYFHVPCGASENEMANCDICHKTFATDSESQFHERIVHKRRDGELLECDLCFVILLSRNCIDQHKILVHNVMPKYKNYSSCEICKKRFLNEDALRIHVGRKQCVN